jgi:peptide/nickel transport system substrate-binding protein
LLTALAAASLVVAACSGDDDDDAVTGDTSEAAATEPAAEGEGGSDTTTADTEATEDTEATDETDTTEAEETEALPGAEDVGTVGGSGCGIPHGPYEDAGGEPAGEVRVAWNDPLLSFNAQSARGNAVANINPLYLMGGLGNGGGFTYYDGDLNFINNDSFGTCTIESLDPLSVTYTVQDDVVWSDGVPVDAADLILTWGATSGVFNDAGTVITEDGTTAIADADGNPVILDAAGAVVPFDTAFDEEGALLPGLAYQEATDLVTFDAASESLALVTQMPEVSEDGKSITATWDSFYVDYQTAGITVGSPAHVVAQKALAIEDPTEAKQALIDAFANNDRAALKKIAEFWNTGFDATSLPDDPALYLSAGPYNLTSYDELSQMTFEANPLYTWGPKPKVETIVYRIIGDPTAAVQAMENEEIDIIQPQATADILTQLEALSGRGVEVLTGDGGTYEHVDLVMNNGGPFDPATYGGDAEKAHMVREAFLKTIPRQDILDRLIKPLNPDAILRDSFTTVPGAPTYDALVAENGSADYAEVDIEGATALLEEAGVTTPIDVRFLFAANNPRRANEYELIRDSAVQAGFNVIDGNSPTWGQDRENPDLYDASLFGWASSAVDIAGTNANFVTEGQNNPQGYSSPAVDDLFAQLQASSDPDEQQDLLLQIEQNLWADAFGVTIFQHPGITAYNGTYVSGIDSIALTPTVFWNFWDWEAA